MKFRIAFTDAAMATLKNLPRHVQAEVLDAIESILSQQPELESKSRVKRLRDFRVPSYRMRVGEHRVFYSVEGDQVIAHAAVTKESANAWLDQFGER